MSLMLSPVHISIDRKGGTSVVFHIQNPNLMLIVPVAHIIFFCIGKAEHQRQVVVFLIIAPEIPFLHKGDNGSVFIGFVLCICGRNAQIDAFFAEYLCRSVKDLIHGAIIIQKIQGVFIQSHTEKFPYIIKRRLIPLFAGYLIPCQNGGIGTVALLDIPLHIAFHFRCQIAPHHMIAVRMDRHGLVGIVVPVFIGFQIGSHKCNAILGKGIIMEFFYKIQTLLDIQIFRCHHSGIIMDVLSIYGQRHRQIGFFSCFQFVTNRKLHHTVALFSGSGLIRLLAIQRRKGIGHLIDRVAVALDLCLCISFTVKRRDGIPHGGQVHFIFITYQRIHFLIFHQEMYPR